MNHYPKLLSLKRFIYFDILIIIAALAPPVGGNFVYTKLKRKTENSASKGCTGKKGVQTKVAFTRQAGKNRKFRFKKIYGQKT